MCLMHFPLPDSPVGPSVQTLAVQLIIVQTHRMLFLIITEIPKQYEYHPVNDCSYFPYAIPVKKSISIVFSFKTGFYLLPDVLSQSLSMHTVSFTSVGVFPLCVLCLFSLPVLLLSHLQPHLYLSTSLLSIGRSVSHSRAYPAYPLFCSS